MDTDLSRALHEIVASTQSLHTHLSRTMESWSRGWDGANLIDPREPDVGPDGDLWIPIGTTGGNDYTCVYRNEAELQRVRAVGRWLAEENEFATNSHENRLAYVIGWGHTYGVTAKQGEEVSDDELAAAKEIVERFLCENRWSPSYVTGARGVRGRDSWGYRQQQNLYRRDRDGEVLLRKFRAEDGILRVRYVEPEHLQTPDYLSGKLSIRYGIETDPNDEETVVAYWINGERVDASEIQHRTRSGSVRHPRGIPIHYVVRKNLIRAQKILRNGSMVTEIQVAIAIIRKHMQATASTVQAFQQALTKSAGNQGNGSQDNRRQRFAPGTILDASAGIEYEFPSMGVDPSRYVAALQADLRGAAAGIGQPEFMLTSDASNSNYASTMVAEGPAVKRFEYLQWDEIAFDISLIWDALSYAVEQGQLSEDLLERIEVTAEPPSVSSRDKLQEAQVAQILNGLGWLSPQTASQQFGLDYSQEQENIEQHQERNGGAVSRDRPELPPGDDEDDEAADEDARDQ